MLIQSINNLQVWHCILIYRRYLRGRITFPEVICNRIHIFKIRSFKIRLLQDSDNFFCIFMPT